MKIYEAKTVFTCVCEDAPIPQTADMPAKVAAYMTGAFDAHPMQESFWILFLNRRNHITGRQMLTLGTQTAALAHPREVFRAALLGNATAIICVHNHPSGDPSPSAADSHVTRQLREAGRAVDIDLIDHVIIGDKGADPLGRGYFSFRDAGLL